MTTPLSPCITPVAGTISEHVDAHNLHIDKSIKSVFERTFGMPVIAFNRNDLQSAHESATSTTKREQSLCKTTLVDITLSNGAVFSFGYGGARQGTAMSLLLKLPNHKVGFLSLNRYASLCSSTRKPTTPQQNRAFWLEAARVFHMRLYRLEQSAKHVANHLCTAFNMPYHKDNYRAPQKRVLVAAKYEWV
jgi:hypothetical protein